jgi:hypothetical protein
MEKLLSTRLSYYIAWIGFLVCGFLVWYFFNKGKQEEQKMLIQSGVNIEDMLKKSDKRRQLWLLKLGIIVIGLGMSFVLIAILNSLHLPNPDPLYPAIFCICIGTSLIIAYKTGKTGHED